MYFNNTFCEDVHLVIVNCWLTDEQWSYTTCISHMYITYMYIYMTLWPFAFCMYMYRYCMCIIESWVAWVCEVKTVYAYCTCTLYSMHFHSSQYKSQYTKILAYVHQCYTLQLLQCMWLFHDLSVEAEYDAQSVCFHEQFHKYPLQIYDCQPNWNAYMYM